MTENSGETQYKHRDIESEGTEHWDRRQAFLLAVKTVSKASSSKKMAIQQ